MADKTLKQTVPAPSVATPEDGPETLLEMDRASGGADTQANQPSMTEAEQKRERRLNTVFNILRYTKMIFLILCWLLFTACLMKFEEEEAEPRMVTIPKGETVIYELPEKNWGENLVLYLSGSFTQLSFAFDEKTATDVEAGCKHLQVIIQEVTPADTVGNITKPWKVCITDELNIMRAEITYVERIFNTDNMDFSANKYQLSLSTNIDEALPFELSLNPCNISRSLGIIVGSVLLSFIYIFLVFDLLHRTLAGVICCTLGIGILAAVRMRQDLLEIVQWIPLDNLMHYFGMSVVMTVLADTGLNDYLAATGYQLFNGHIWPLLNVLLAIAWFMPILFNNITIALFMTPICLRLCDIMALNHVPVLTCLMVAINIGSALSISDGATTVTIMNNSALGRNKVKSSDFIVHMFIPVLLATAQSYLHLRLLYINSARMGILSREGRKLEQQIKSWRQAAKNVGMTYAEERKFQENVDQRIKTLNTRLQRLGKMPEPSPNYEENLKNIAHYFTLRNLVFLVAGLTSLMVMLVFTLLTLFTKVTYLSPGWTAIVAALLALTIIDLEDLDMIMTRIDWGNMIFIAAQYILVKVLMKLGLLESIGVSVDNIIFSVPEKHRLLVGLIIIAWLSAFLTTIMDNMPVANMMMRIIVRLTRGYSRQILPRGPMIWALSLGCCLGANGSLVASYGNLMCSGVANMYGYPVKFLTFLIIGFPVMVGSVLVVTIYMLIAHVWIGWN